MQLIFFPIIIQRLGFLFLSKQNELHSRSEVENQWKIMF